MKVKNWLLIGLIVLVSFASASALRASEQTFSGRIIYVDPKVNAFAVKGATETRAFHPDKCQITIGGEPKLLAELMKGEEVTVTYETTRTMHMAHRVVSATPVNQVNEKEFEGQITALNPKAESLTVKGEGGEMTFFIEPQTRLYIGGERTPFSQLQKGETVTVTYKPEGAKDMVLDVAHGR